MKKSGKITKKDRERDPYYEKLHKEFVEKYEKGPGDSFIGFASGLIGSSIVFIFLIDELPNLRFFGYLGLGVAIALIVIGILKNKRKI